MLVENPLLPLPGGAEPQLAVLSDLPETGLPEQLLQLRRFVGVLLVNLLPAAPQPAGLQPEDVHSIGADAPALRPVGPPDAVGILALVQKHLAVQAPELLRGVDVKEEEAAGHEEGVHPPEGPGQLFGAGDVVDAVQAAHAGVDSAVEIQLLHGLMQKDRLDGACAPAFLRRLGQHLLGQVGADHLIAPLRQDTGQAPGAAGQIQHRADGQPAAGEVLLQIVGPAGIVHVGGKGVVAPRQEFICHRRPASP